MFDLYGKYFESKYSSNMSMWFGNKSTLKFSQSFT